MSKELDKLKKSIENFKKVLTKKSTKPLPTTKAEQPKQP